MTPSIAPGCWGCKSSCGAGVMRVSGVTVLEWFGLGGGLYCQGWGEVPENLRTTGRGALLPFLARNRDAANLAVHATNGRSGFCSLGAGESVCSRAF